MTLPSPCLLIPAGAVRSSVSAVLAISSMSCWLKNCVFAFLSRCGAIPSIHGVDKKASTETLAILAGAGALAMGLFLVPAFVGGGFFREGRTLMALHGGIVSLVDLHAAFILFSAWTVYREGITLHSTIWIAALLALGSFAICRYILFSPRTVDGNWDTFS